MFKGILIGAIVLLCSGSVAYVALAVEPAPQNIDWDMESGDVTETVISENGGSFKVHNNGPDKVYLVYSTRDEDGKLIIHQVLMGPNSSHYALKCVGKIVVFLENGDEKSSTGTFKLQLYYAGS